MAADDDRAAARAHAVFDIHGIAGRFPDTAATMLVDTRLTDAIRRRLRRLGLRVTHRVIRSHAGPVWGCGVGSAAELTAPLKDLAEAGGSIHQPCVAFL